MKKLLLFLSIAAILLVIPSQAKAIVIYDTFGPGNSYETGWGWSIGSPDWTQGDAFMPTGGSYALDRIELTVALLAGPNELDVWLMNDNSGTPYTILESYHFSGQMGIFGDAILDSPLIGNSLLHPVLNNGERYWLIASPGDPETDAAWYGSNPEVTGGHASREGLDAWSAEDDIQGAFRIVGQDTAAVPEPASLSLLGLGLLGLAGLKRAKRITR